MASIAGNGEESMLDRMENIAEEEEDMMDDEDDVEDASIDPDLIFGRSSSSMEHGDDEDDDDDDMSYAGDEEDIDEEDDPHSDENTDAATPLEYEWNPGSVVVGDGTSPAEFHVSAITLEDLVGGVGGNGDSLSEETSHSSIRRSSFTNQYPRRVSNSRFSFNSAQSAPGGGLLSSSPTSPPAQRRVTITVPNNGPGPEQENEEEKDSKLPPKPLAQRSVTRRRQSFAFRPNPPKSSSASVNSNNSSNVDGDESTSTPPGSTGSNRPHHPRFMRKSRRSLTAPPINTNTNGSKNADVFDSVDSAIHSLGGSAGTGGGNEWEHVAAAAAVVAAGTTGKGSAKGPRIQFAVDEKVLVFLNILNHTNAVDSRDTFTVNPVNKYGYPPGEGNKTHEMQGPYVYVLATIRKLHFDEDVPYYTVARADTGTEQRADTAWMEPIKLANGIEAALRAAQQTSRTAVETEIKVKDDQNPWCSALLAWPAKFFRERLVPFYRRARASCKRHVTLLLYGNSPYACKLHTTGINVLVTCSFIYLFHEVVALSFFGAKSDFAIATVAVVVWSILVLELMLEWLIRNPDYNDLIVSDKAYAPSTSRNINAFHLVFETIALVLFIPNFLCLSSSIECGRRLPFSAISASLDAILGPTRWYAAYGRLVMGLRSLRLYGLVRHWKKMWINNTFRDAQKRRGIFRNMMLLSDGDLDLPETLTFSRMRKSKVADEVVTSDEVKVANEEDQRLKKAATIGTALMVVNSHRALFLLSVIVTLLPMIRTIDGVNRMAPEMVDILQQNNLQAGTDCNYLENAVASWLNTAAIEHRLGPSQEFESYVLWAQIEPVRCPSLQGTSGVITTCNNTFAHGMERACEVWDNITTTSDVVSESFFANRLGVRVGGIVEYVRQAKATMVDNGNIFNNSQEFRVRVFVNHNPTVSNTNLSEFLLMVSVLGLCLCGLTVLRGDAGRLVLHPLQRMLKIVVRYAQNPLSHTDLRKSRRRRSEGGDDNSNDGADRDREREQLGNYETEQLINAISKIADLLRKCWGVAGAGIISTNLARTVDGKTVVFNPTVPGKRVYALFGFVAINGFSDQLRALDRDVMILINDVAKVVHDEVYRWSLGDTGQCNKNLGGAFLMVFRIGDFDEVHQRQARATDVVFNTSKDRKRSNIRRRNAKASNHGYRGIRKRDRRNPADDTLQLASLPGIQVFSDRALLGMLKSYAGIHRDRNLQNWKKDFRLGAGVGAYTVNIIVGMDAGWAVEGAVGSEYKIDATYLSPHVNMASRMMSATKQYGVTILVSQAVEELLSTPARGKLRHLDTVYVKGSSVSQRIFTFDARHKGVDFFLFERSGEQADVDAEAYTPQIWETDQDLRAMRQHVTEDFETKFRTGKDQYLAGDWKNAMVTLQEADDSMITTVLEEGYIDYNPDEIDGRIFDRDNRCDEVMRVRAELGDGACKCLLGYMERRKGIPPDNWNGVRPLTSK